MPNYDVFDAQATSFKFPEPKHGRLLGLAGFVGSLDENKSKKQHMHLPLSARTFILLTLQHCSQVERLLKLNVEFSKPNSGVSCVLVKGAGGKVRINDVWPMTVCRLQIVF